VFGGKRLILYELNEVPLRVFHWFSSRYPASAIAHLLQTGTVFETYTEDEGHLSPWITWPTLHRGITNARHCIFDFGQDLTATNECYPPIWELIARSGGKVGVFGSLHSYPLPHLLDNYAFYVPDTFAAGPECFPAKYQVFQHFNLSMVDLSARNVPRALPWRQAAKFVAAAPGLGLRGTTMAKLAVQLVAEKANPNRVVRRRTSQAQIAFDFFLSELKQTRPEFTTFFTNHVASSLHRYWPALFPQDYSKRHWDDSWQNTWEDEIPFTLRQADAQLSDLINFVRADGRYALLIATSMGQAAQSEITQAVLTELSFYDLSRFMRMLGVPDDAWHRERAMSPQYVVRVRPGLENEFTDNLAQVSINDRPISFTWRGSGVFRIDLGQPNLCTESIVVRWRNQNVSLSEAGLVNLRIQDEACASADHVSQGVFIVYKPGHSGARTAKTVSTVQIAPSMLLNFGIVPPAYMGEAITVQ
jgi:hypothetical protein